MNRRQLLASLAATPSLLAQQPSAVKPVVKLGPAAFTRPWRLRYAPRIGLVQGLSIPDQLQIYADYGFRAFEYNGLPGHSMQELEQFRKKMDDTKMSMGVFVVNRGGWRETAMPDKGGHNRLLADVKRAVEIHKVIGNECATVCSGLGVPHLTFAQQTENCIEVLKRAADIVSGTKMVLVLEPLNQKVDHAGYFVTYSEHAGEIIAGANHPQIKILFDMYHQQISEGNLINHLNHYWDLIGYFQIGDVPGRREPGTGEVNWQNVFKAIHAKDYQGILGMEHGMSQPGEAGLRRTFEEYRKADSWT